MINAQDLAGMAQQLRADFPQTCTLTRLVGTEAQTSAATPARVAPASRQLYPFAAIPDQPVQRWEVHLPSSTDVQANDLLTLGDERLFVVIHTTNPGVYLDQPVALCVLSATGADQPLGSAYLRPNTTVLTTRAGQTVYDARRVHMAFAQANPAAPLERLQGGVATLRVALFDLVDADLQQGDAVQILAQDGATAPPDVRTFTLAGVVRRPLPFTILEADCLADILA